MARTTRTAVHYVDQANRLVLQAASRPQGSGAWVEIARREVRRERRDVKTALSLLERAVDKVDTESDSHAAVFNGIISAADRMGNERQRHEAYHHALTLALKTARRELIKVALDRIKTIDPRLQSVRA